MNTLPLRKLLWIVVIFTFSSSYVVSFEDDTVSVTISNGTAHYVHLTINSESFVYVPPGGSVQTETRMSTAFVEVFYSPGQGVSGRAAKELTSITTTTYSGGYSNTCSNNQSSGCEVTDSDSHSSTTSRSPMSWRVTPADFSTDSTAASN